MNIADSPESVIRLPLNWVDYLILVIYFVVAVWIGYSIHRRQKSSEDFLLAGRSIPAWIAGLAFISANLGATEVLGMAANGAQIGISTLHYYLIGAIPGMVFLGIVMMPFYYGSKVRSVPEFMEKRFGRSTHLWVSLTFAVSTILVAGINLYAMSLILQAMLGWNQWVAIAISAVFVLLYITLGGLTSAIYNEVMQFFVIIAALLPLTIIGLTKVGGWSGLTQRFAHLTGLPKHMLNTWQGTAVGNIQNPIGADWLGIILGLGFVLSFGYWTTNFTEVQRAFSAKDMSAARRTPIIGAIPKMFVGFLVIIPGLIAAATMNNLFVNKTITYNEVIPKLMQQYLPNGTLGIAITGLMASFMAGMAANVSSFNTVVTYDIMQYYTHPGRSDKFYLNAGRWVTFAGTVISIATAILASQYGNIMTYMQVLFSFFNAPLFAVFIFGLFWKRLTPAAGSWAYVCGILAPLITYILYLQSVAAGHPMFVTATAETLYGAMISFATTIVVGFVVSLLTKPKTDEQLEGLTLATGGMEYFKNGLKSDKSHEQVWWKRPTPIGIVVVIVSFLIYIPFF